MKYVKNLIPVFMIAALLGVYLGVSNGKRSENRGIASPQTKLQELFPKRTSTQSRDTVFMTSVEGEDYCELINDIDEYVVTLTADGVTSGDKEINLSLYGNCNSQRGLVVFDSAICAQSTSYESLSEGFLGNNEIQIRGKNLDMTIPTKKLSYFISSLEVTYRNEKKETVEPSLDEIKVLYSCKDTFDL